MSLQKIKYTSTGKTKFIAAHLAFREDLMKTHGYIPVDENDEPLTEPLMAEKKSPSKNPVAPAAEEVSEESANEEELF